MDGAPSLSHANERAVIGASREIGFAPHLHTLLRAHYKTVTYRIGFGPVAPGDVLRVRDTDMQIIVTEVAEVPFGQLPLAGPGHEAYAERAEMRETFQSYYGRLIADDEPVTVIHFNLS